MKSARHGRIKHRRLNSQYSNRLTHLAPIKKVLKKDFSKITEESQESDRSCVQESGYKIPEGARRVPLERNIEEKLKKILNKNRFSSRIC